MPSIEGTRRTPRATEKAPTTLIELRRAPADAGRTRPTLGFARVGVRCVRASRSLSPSKETVSRFAGDPGCWHEMQTSTPSFNTYPERARTPSAPEQIALRLRVNAVSPAREAAISRSSSLSFSTAVPSALVWRRSQTSSRSPGAAAGASAYRSSSPRAGGAATSRATPSAARRADAAAHAPESSSTFPSRDAFVAFRADQRASFREATRSRSVCTLST